MAKKGDETIAILEYRIHDFEQARIIHFYWHPYLKTIRGDCEPDYWVASILENVGFTHNSCWFLGVKEGPRVFTIADLANRIVSPEEHQKLWVDRCQAYLRAGRHGGSADGRGQLNMLHTK